VFRNPLSKRPGQPARVLVVDDDPLFAATLTLLLSEHDEVAVVGRARNGAEGVELTLELRPDVVLMDVQMPVMDGIEAAQCIVARLRSARVVMITSTPDPDVAGRARAAGAAGFLAKGCDVEEILEAIAGRSRVPPRPRFATCVAIGAATAVATEPWPAA
jgi:DNA-binding NarL/FixJ family response regulator